MNLFFTKGLCLCPRNPQDGVLLTGAEKKFQLSDFLNTDFSSSNTAISGFTIIQIDEPVHVSALQELIVGFGKSPLSSTCSFDFFELLVDVETMVMVTQLVENVDVRVYPGATHLTEDMHILTCDPFHCDH